MYAGPMLKRFLERRLPTTYGEQTYESPYWFVRIPHQMRYQTARDAVLARRPMSLLDYGAGDGRLLFDLIESGLTASCVVAYEPVEYFQSKLRADLTEAALAKRVRVIGERSALHRESFEFIACLGVLEHMPLAERQAFYDVCEATLAPDGQIFVDVPVEIGPTLLVKHLTRVMLKGREREYDATTLWRAAAGARVHDPARYDPSDTRSWIHDHKGFDYRLFREELGARFKIVGEQTTPFPRLPAVLGNQEIYFHAVLK